MVTGAATFEAVAMSRDHPDLAIGLHWDVWGEDEREFDLTDRKAVKEEFHRQMDEFHRLFERPPSHIDSHRHAHREDFLFPLFLELAAPFGIPLRGDGSVRFVGGFYAQWEWMVTNLAHVSVRRLQEMLRNEVAEGWTEFSCHPGYVSPDYHAVYLKEREAEVATLTDPVIRRTVEEVGICLVSYNDYAAWQQQGKI